MVRSQFKLAAASIATVSMLAMLPFSAHAAAPAHHIAIDETAGAVCNGWGYTTIARASITDNTGKIIGESRRNGCSNDLSLQWNTVVSTIGTQRLHAEIYQSTNSSNGQQRDCNATGCTTPAVRVSNPGDGSAYGYLTGPSGYQYVSNPIFV